MAEPGSLLGGGRAHRAGTRIALAAALVAVLVALPIATARATLPGTNGKIAFVRDGDIWTINPNGSDLKQVTSGPAQDHSPAWSPDGSTIAFSRNEPLAQSDIWLVRPGSEAVQFTNTTNSEAYPAWAPDGVRLSFRRNVGECNIGVIVRLDGASVRTMIAGQNEWSPDGSKIAVGYAGCNNYGPLWVENDSGGGGPFPGNDLVEAVDGYDSDPSWSPDGSTVAYSTVRYSDATTWIKLIRADGTGVTPLTFPGGLNDVGADQPSWSPDGRQIAFRRKGTIWLRDADGSNQQPITEGSEPEWQRLPPPITTPAPNPATVTPLTPSPGPVAPVAAVQRPALRIAAVSGSSKIRFGRRARFVVRLSGPPRGRVTLQRKRGARFVTVVSTRARRITRLSYRPPSPGRYILRIRTTATGSVATSRLLRLRVSPKPKLRSKPKGTGGHRVRSPRPPQPALPGDIYNCGDFPLSDGTTAQDYLRRYPSDPSGLDGDGNGVACEG